MTFWMRAISTTLLLLSLMFPFFSIAQTTTNRTSQSNTSGNSKALLYSGVGLAGILGGAYVLNLFGGSAAVAAKSAIKAVPTFPFSFGGHVVQVIPCIHGALWVAIRSLRGVVPTLEFYIWTPLTITHLMGPPKILNEGILGIADAPMVCVTPAAVTLPGFRMTIVGTSGLPQF